MDSWIVPVWSLKNEELFLIRLGIVHAWEVFDSWIVHAWEVFDSWILQPWSLKKRSCSGLDS